MAGGVKAKEFNFTIPPNAPVFEPTWEEFQDPLAYINKIRPIADKAGICKIKPPPDWQPPFAVDVDNFKFTPRIQRLNELEPCKNQEDPKSFQAKTRIKLNFLDQIAKFWELQGSSLKIPVVERKALDLYTLHRLVQCEGGKDAVTRERKWNKVAARMGLPQGKSLGSLLRNHYERILYPYDVFQQGKAVSDIPLEQDSPDSTEKRDKDYKPHGIPSRQAVMPPQEKGRRSNRYGVGADFIEGMGDGGSSSTSASDNKELRRLQFYGAGPKMAGYNTRREDAKDKSRGKKPNYDFDPIDGSRRSEQTGFLDLAKYVCHNCKRGDSEESMLLCDGCDDSYHTFCLVPPLTEVPKGDWRCPRCVAEEVSKPVEAFGFEQAQREYTLQQFGEMADTFKSNYFNMPVHLVPTEMVEKEFWRIVSSIDEDVTVEYGADLHTMDHGSGFPTKNSKLLLPGDEEYANSGWNLNNLPVMEGSVLKHINADISGMKVPWMYVGMCFATFCWHNEDHWSYSINYLHWGEPKTWYGVPGHCAEDFETAMKQAAPELFQSQPDLLHQLVTIMNPNILMKTGVPVFRTDQHAGEFVVTFPRAYHAGFNQGYNFAEAVNFAPADWLSIGRECITHYSNLRRFCVFSHDELVCKMASNPEQLDLTVAAATYQDMIKMVDAEKKLRKSLLEWGVTEAERDAFELLPDDERQCDMCKTTCFLSAVTCTCTTEHLVCLRHYKQLCDCSPESHTLRYRYTLDELPLMLHRLKLRAESYDTWATRVKEALQAGGEDKVELLELRGLLQEAEQKKFPDSELLQTVVEAVHEAEKCVSVAQQLASKKVRTRTRQAGEAKYKLSIEEMQLFCEQLDHLACRVKEAEAVKDLVDKVMDFQRQATGLLEEDQPDSKDLGKCLELGLGLDIELPEMPKLKQKQKQMEWLEEVADLTDDPQQATLESLRHMLSSGVSLPPHPTIEKTMGELQERLTQMERWEEKAGLCLQAKPRHPISVIESLVQEAGKLPAALPNFGQLKDALKKAKEWTAKVEVMQRADKFPYLDALESMVTKGRLIPIRLDQLPQLESQVNAAKAWKERTGRTFLKKNSHYTLLDVLSPREDVGVLPMKAKKRRVKEDPDAAVVKEEAKPPKENSLAVPPPAQGQSRECREMEAMRQLRVHNVQKRSADPAGTGKYCVCRKGISGFTLQCELCKDWFHGTCVPLPKSPHQKGKQPGGGNTSTSTSLSQLSARELKFLCPCCLRSRRPRLETILALLVSLQKLPVRLQEGEALHGLTERAMNWQDRARQALATGELSSALAKLSILSQRLVEVAAREKTQKIISSELRKAASNPELHQRVQMQLAKMEDEDAATAESSPAVTEPGSPVASAPAEEEGTYNNSEHAYSTASKLGGASVANGGARKHSRKSPLVPRQLEPPVLELTEAAKAQLEELMMEGDLLEVSLDETQHIWRILQATKPRKEEKFPDFEEMEQEIAAARVEKERAREKKRIKRRVEESEGGFTSTKRIKVKIGGRDSEDRMLKRRLIKEKRRIKVDIGPGAGAPGGKEKPRKIRRKMEGEKRKIVRVKKKKKVSSDEDEDCAAVKCLKPTGMEVNWVQCDGGCEQWFHLLCVGLNKHEVKEEEDYICKKCCTGVDEEENLSQPMKTEDQTEPARPSHPPEGLEALLSLGDSIPPPKSDPPPEAASAAPAVEDNLDDDGEGEMVIDLGESKDLRNSEEEGAQLAQA